MITFNDVKQYITFCLVGVLNTLVDLAIFNILLFIYEPLVKWMVVLYNITAFLVATLNSYFINQQVTFKRADGRLAHFIMASVIALCINNLIFLSVIYVPQSYLNGKLLLNAAKIIAALITSAISFLIMKTFVFTVKQQA